MITLAELKAYLGIASGDTSQDARLQLILDATNQYVEDVTLYNWGTDKTRSEVWDYRDNIYLGRMGIKTITSLKLYQSNTEEASDELSARTDYTFNELGRLTLDFSYGDDYNRDHYNSVHVTYTYGKKEGETMPADLKLAALQYAKEYDEASQGNDSRRVKSESTGSYRIEFTESSTITDTFKRYRVPRL